MSEFDNPPTRILGRSHASPKEYKKRMEVSVPPDMPGIVIMVHGVNSEGEWYGQAEKYLLAGLNQRLGRTDLKPRDWDRFNARPLPETSDTSPVIHFFWGYSAPKGEEKRWIVPLMDKDRKSAWAKDYAPQPPCYWGGGPFQNGCNNLPLVWSEQGFRRWIWAAFIPANVQALNPEVDRQLRDAPARTYYAHAANRLAKLVRKIRGKYPADTITLISHSQGTMITLATLSLLEADNQPDCVMLMNGPYAMESKATDSFMQGNDAPTPGARLRTFENIVKRFRQGYRALTSEHHALLRVGVTAEGARWTPAAPGERDNTGRIYCYFNPHDRVMGSTALQSIGWQGLPEDLIKKYPDTLYQRMLARTTACGEAPGYQYLWPRDLDGSLKPFWNKMKKTRIIPTDLWATPDKNKQVWINAEAVPEPIQAKEMVDFDTQSDSEPRWKDQDGFNFYRDIYQREEWKEDGRPRGPHDTGSRRRLETQEEMEQRIGAYVPEPTDHSTLPAHEIFLPRVVAFDLPIGFCQSHQDLAFWKELNHDADWRQCDRYFFTAQLELPSMSDLIDRETYGELSKQRDQTAALWRASRDTEYA